MWGKTFIDQIVRLWIEKKKTIQNPWSEPPGAQIMYQTKWIGWIEMK